MNPSSPLPGPSNRHALIAWGILLVVLFPAFLYLANHPDWFLATERNQSSLGMIRGSDLEQQGRYGDALGAYRDALKFYQEQLEKTDSVRHRAAVATVHHKMGLLFLKRDESGDRERAKEQFERAVELDAGVGQGEGQFLLGDLERDRNPESALERYAGVIASVSSQLAVRAYKNRAEILAGLERWDEAYRAWCTALTFHPWEPDEETAKTIVQIAGHVHCTTGTVLGRAYLRLADRTKAIAALQSLAGEDPSAAWTLADMTGTQPPVTDGIRFNPANALVASAGIDSASFTWPAGCMVEFVAGTQLEGRRLALTLQPDGLHTEKMELSIFLNGTPGGTIEVNSGSPSEYETQGVLRAGRNVLEIRCSHAWFEPDDLPVITVLGRSNYELRIKN
ncbi:MAG TPA: tetratricopeptide repeat protein [bacterium]|nr:tetratricopeptide repeat protein [bacterium]HQP99362.1 tetratricopeptide repeat protein [bacterium]